VSASSAAGGGPFVHEALFYRSPGEFLAETVPFVRAGLAAEEPVLVAVPPASGGWLRGALGVDADRVRFADMTQIGRNPGWIIPWMLHTFAAEHPGRRLRIIGEPVWPGRAAVEYPPCVQHESLANIVFAGRPARGLCPYDAAGLSPQVVADAARTHPVLVDGGRRAASDDYGPPGEVAARFNQPLPAPPKHAAALRFDGSELAVVRAAVAGRAARAGLPVPATGDLVFAVNEVATNAVRHGGGGGTMWLWCEDGKIVIQIRDGGYLADPMAGRLPPSPGSRGGHGLVFVNYLCDLVRVHTDVTGTTTRLHFGVRPRLATPRRPDTRS
jgi:anti-sigma regulatory factor (Ser/Thr protein kinase)